jgi:hypothetical protein
MESFSRSSLNDPVWQRCQKPDELRRHREELGSGSKSHSRCLREPMYLPVPLITPEEVGGKIDGNVVNVKFSSGGGAWVNDICPKATATGRSASARISIEPTTSSNASSTGSSSALASQSGTTSSLRITLPLSSSRRDGYGFALMSPRPSALGRLGGDDERSTHCVGAARRPTNTSRDSPRSRKSSGNHE